MKDIALCFPEIFYTPRMQEFIMQRCRDNDKQWIYSMIAGTPLKREGNVTKNQGFSQFTGHFSGQFVPFESKLPYIEWPCFTALVFNA